MIPGIVAAGAMLLSSAAPVGGGGGPVAIGTGTTWRITFDALNTDTYVGIREWRFYDINDNLISLAGATYSEGGAGTQGGHGASAPFDGNAGTYFLRSGAPCFCQIVLPAAITPYRMEFENEGLARAPIRFTISVGGVNCFTAWEPSWNAAGVIRSWPQTPAAGQYKAYRIRPTVGNGDRFLRMWEIELRGSAGGADLATGGATFQSFNAGYNVFPQAFDNNTATTFDFDTATNALPQWIAYGFPTPVSIAQYTILGQELNTRTLNTWTLDGSNDGTLWTTVDSRAGITWAVPETKIFTI